MDSVEHDGGGTDFSERGVDTETENISADNFKRREMRAQSNETSKEKKPGKIGELRRFSSGANLNQGSNDNNGPSNSRQFFSTDDLSRQPKRNKKKRSASGNNFRDDEFYHEALRSINKYRRMHDAKPLKMHHRMNSHAKDYVKKLAKGQTANSRLGKKYGVTMFQRKMLSPTEKLTGNEVVSEWYSEITDFIFAENTEDLIQKGSNFSQIVWKNSSEIGLGIARSEDQMTVYVVGLFKPQGNNRGHYSKQVSPAMNDIRDDSDSSSDDGHDKMKNGMKDAAGNKKEKKSSRLSQFLSRLFKPSKSSNHKGNKGKKEAIVSPKGASTKKDNDSSSNSSGDTRATFKVQDSTKASENHANGSHVIDKTEAEKEKSHPEPILPTSLLKYISVDENIKYSDVVYPLESQNGASNEQKLQTPTTIDSPSDFLEKTDSYFGIEHSVSVQSGQNVHEEKIVSGQQDNLSNEIYSTSDSRKSSISTHDNELSEKVAATLQNALAGDSSTSSSSTDLSKSSPHVEGSFTFIREYVQSNVVLDSELLPPEYKTTFEQENNFTADKEFLKGEIADNYPDDSVLLEKITFLEKNQESHNDHKQNDSNRYSLDKTPSKIISNRSSSSSSSSNISEKSIEFQLKNVTHEINKNINLNEKENLSVKEFYDHIVREVGNVEGGNSKIDNAFNEEYHKYGTPYAVQNKATDSLPDKSEITLEINLDRKSSTSSESSANDVHYKPILDINPINKSFSSSDEAINKSETVKPPQKISPTNSNFSSDESLHSFKVIKVVKDKKSPTSKRSWSSSSDSSSDSDESKNNSLPKIESFKDETQQSENNTFEKSDDISDGNVRPLNLQKDIDSDSNSSEERTRILVEKYFPMSNVTQSRKSSTSSSNSEKSDTGRYEVDEEDLSLKNFPPNNLEPKYESSTTSSSSSSSDNESQQKDKFNKIKNNFVKKMDSLKNTQTEKSLLNMDKFSTKILKEINKYRVLHDVRPLNLDYYLCCLAKKRAGQMLLPEDKQKTLYNYGELSYQSYDMAVTETSIASSWYQTGKSYRFGDVPEEEHWPFTQLIWKDTVEFGAGGIYVEKEKKYILVALFNPEGNVAEEYKTQINPPKIL